MEFQHCVCRLFAGGICIVLVTCSSALADGAVVIPLSGIKGNAMPWDVEQGVTFSSKKAGKDAVGTLAVQQDLETYTTPVYGMSFKLLPAGTFTMGSPGDEPGRGADETQHQVTLSHSFYMQVTEVTQQQWKAVVLAAEAAGYLAVDELDEEPSGSVPVPPADPFQPSHPVENITWANVTKWIGALNQLTGRIYVLPTEAQWEYAARATTTTPWTSTYSYDDSPTGEVITDAFNSNLDPIGWYKWNNTNSGYVTGTKTVARKQANSWGLYDMHGNVFEWCRDWWGEYGVDDPGCSGTPVTCTDPQGPPTGVRSHVYRGGSSLNNANYARSAKRTFLLVDDAAYSTLGFRLALEAQ